MSDLPAVDGCTVLAQGGDGTQVSYALICDSCGTGLGAYAGPGELRAAADRHACPAVSES